MIVTFPHIITKEGDYLNVEISAKTYLKFKRLSASLEFWLFKNSHEDGMLYLKVQNHLCIK